MPDKLFERIHIKLYEEIIKGKFNPTNSRFANPETLRGLVEEANTMCIAVLSIDENPRTFIESKDFTTIGYMSETDFDLDIRQRNNNVQEIYIKPIRIYELKEVIDIPYFNSFKCVSYLELLGDEFERIKIRAEKILEKTNDEKLIRAFANKHVQIAKKLFYDAKRSLIDAQKANDPEDIYIFFALNLFIVRTILLYQKMFKPYLKQEPDSEVLLFHEVLKELSLRKLCSLFPTRKSGYCNYVKKSFVEKSILFEGMINETQTEQGEDFLQKKSSHILQGKLSYSPAKCNCQINVLVDILTQLTEEITVSGKPVIEMSAEDLLNFILTNFIDRNGKEFSYYTIHTLLKKSRVDKRLHPQSPKRIDVSKHFKGEK